MQQSGTIFFREFFKGFEVLLYFVPRDESRVVRQFLQILVWIRLVDTKSKHNMHSLEEKVEGKSLYWCNLRLNVTLGSEVLLHIFEVEVVVAVFVLPPEFSSVPFLFRHIILHHFVPTIFEAGVAFSGCLRLVKNTEFFIRLQFEATTGAKIYLRNLTKKEPKKRGSCLRKTYVYASVAAFISKPSHQTRVYLVSVG